TTTSPTTMFSSLPVGPPLGSTLFPYTTLFRSLGKKGARITSHVALPGRFLVYMPTVHHTGVSRKIISAENRSRLRRLVSEAGNRSEEHTSELQSRFDLVCRLLLEKKKQSMYRS